MATATADPNQRRLMLLLPLVFVVILYRYPAGLLVYWITTNLWTIVQQYFIRRHIGPAPPVAGKEPGGAGGIGALLGRKPDQPLSTGAKGEPALVGAGGGSNGASGVAPPRSPRKKKKRSGRRR